MDRIDPLEGFPSIGGALLRRCSQSGDNAGRNAGRNTRKNAGRNTRARSWSRRAALAVTLGGAARSGAGCPPCCLCAVLASVNAPRSACTLYVPQWPPSDAGALLLPSSHTAITAPRLSGLRACLGVKRGDCRDLSGFVWIRRKLPEYAQCPSAALLGTLGGMSHATPTTRQQTRGAPPVPTWKGLARTWPALPNAAQRCPARPAALPVLGTMRDNLAHAVRRNGFPRYAGRADVNSTRSAAFPLRPPDALGSPHRFERRGVARLTAWRRASWRQARSVGHSAAGGLSPMQGQQETQNHQRRASHGAGLRASLRNTRGTLNGTALVPAARVVASMLEGDQP